MSDAFDALGALGQNVPYSYAGPTAEMLETFLNPALGREYSVIFSSPEFTAVCPVTGQPDFYTVKIAYAPQARCVESKSAKLYLGAFRQEGMFIEALANRLLDDWWTALSPNRLAVVLKMAPRGGIAIKVRVYRHVAARPPYGVGDV